MYGQQQKKGGFPVKYNAPVILTFTLVSTGVMLFSQILGPGILSFFMVPGRGMFRFPFDLPRLVSHAIGHANWQHLVGNFSFILLLGPILEERYGSGLLLVMMFLTAFVTGMLNVLFFTHPLLGASGIVFMLILLISFTNVRKGEIPLTFILIILLFLGQEIYRALAERNNISEFAHIIGGACGGLFGFFLGGTREKGKSVEDSIGGL